MPRAVTVGSHRGNASLASPASGTCSAEIATEVLIGSLIGGKAEFAQEFFGFAAACADHSP